MLWRGIYELFLPLSEHLLLARHAANVDLAVKTVLTYVMSPNSKRSWAISASPCDTCPPPASWPWSSWRPKTWRKWTWEACQVRRIVTACVCGRVCARWLSLWQALLSVITHALQHTLCLSCNANNYPKPSLVTIRFVQKNRTSVEFFTPPPKKPSKFCEDCEETPLFRQNVVLKEHTLCWRKDWTSRTNETYSVRLFPWIKEGRMFH